MQEQHCSNGELVDLLLHAVMYFVINVNLCSIQLALSLNSS